MKKTKKATVRFQFTFPIDMLRYDSCWPATEQDAGEITRSFRCSPFDGTTPRGLVTVKMDARNSWTPERWKSFGASLEEVA